MTFSPRFIFIEFMVAAVCLIVFYLLKNSSKRFKKTSGKSFLIVVMVILIITVEFYRIRTGIHSNTYCVTDHFATISPPKQLVTATDYFEMGNYDYDLGKCSLAIADYGKAIKMNPDYAEAYNNRAYTFMMEQNYLPALDDLDRAIQLRPDYVNARMNRGDIYNYYYHIDRNLAIADYRHVLQIDPGMRDHSSVCGHLFLAKHNGWNIGSLSQFPWGVDRSCN